MPTGQPRSVVDIPNQIWDAAVKTWRAGHDQQAQAEALEAQAGQAALKATADAIHKRNRDLAAGGAQVRRVVVNSRPVQLGLALFGDKPPTEGPQTGVIDYRAVNRNMDEVDGRLRRGAEAGRLSGDPEVAPYMAVGTFLRWINDVRPGRRWDTKAQGPGSPEERLKAHERQGNINYGATAAALGLSEEVALRGAGLQQRITAVGQALRGDDLQTRVGFVRPPYGDDPRDQVAISEGYAYERQRMARPPR